MALSSRASFGLLERTDLTQDSCTHWNVYLNGSGHTKPGATEKESYCVTDTGGDRYADTTR